MCAYNNSNSNNNNKNKSILHLLMKVHSSAFAYGQLRAYVNYD